MDKFLRLRQVILDSGLSYAELEKRTGIAKSNLQRYAAGITKKIPMSALEAIANATGVSPAYIMGWDTLPDGTLSDAALLRCSNLLPPPHYVKKPRLGTIACGEPILAVENIEEYDFVPDHVHCDFTLKCKGDSMINARIFDGDIVYVRRQETVDNGEIAAVLIGDEATLKRVRIYADHIALEPENPQYRPLVYWGEEMNAVQILGKAVAFTASVR